MRIICVECCEYVSGKLVCSDCGAYLCEKCLEDHVCEEDEEIEEE